MRRVFDLRMRGAALASAVAIVATTLVIGLPAPAGAASLTGTPWHPMTTPVSTNGGQLNAVSCPPPVSNKFCMAVGQTNSTLALADVWKGSWKASPVPAPGTASVLTGVSCTSPTFCVAVGNAQSPTAAVFADVWNGTTWSVSMDTAVDATLSSVSCTSPTSCLAGGYSGTPVNIEGITSTTTPFATQWDGSTWTTVSPSGPNGAFAGTSCGNPDGQCLAAGVAIPDGFESNTTIAATYDGTTWTSEPPVNPPKPDNAMKAVSCSTVTNLCMAVGWNNCCLPNAFPIADVWNGVTDTWTATTPVDTEGTQVGYDIFQGVSCPAFDLCIAVGDDGANTSGVFGEGWNGTKWVKMSMGALSPLLVVGDYLDLNAVSCASATFCVAVGDKDGANRSLQTGAASWGSAPLL